MVALSAYGQKRMSFITNIDPVDADKSTLYIHAALRA
jgi:hypothetical protein